MQDTGQTQDRAYSGQGIFRTQDRTYTGQGILRTQDRAYSGHRTRYTQDRTGQPATCIATRTDCIIGCLST